MLSSTNIFFILINYFNESQTARFIQNELLNQNNLICNVIVVDNGSSDKEILKQIESLHCLILTPSENLGYLGAAQFAYERIIKNKIKETEGVVVCNVDIEFKQTDFILRLGNVISNTEAAIIGPDITSSFLGQKQNPYMTKRILKSKIRMLHFLTSNILLYNSFLILYFLKTKLKSFSSSNEAKESMIVYGVHGSFMCFTKKWFDSGLSFSYPVFLFGEEIYLAELASKYHLKILYEPSLKIIHQEHTTTGIFKKKKTVAFLHDAYNYLLKEFF